MTLVAPPAALVDRPAARRPRGIAPFGIAGGVATAGALAWLCAPAYGTDLAAAVQWALEAGRHPTAIVDFSWYGGVEPFAYSVLAPSIFWLIGARVTAALATVVAALLGASVFRSHGRSGTRATAWWALALLANLIVGRATFVLGVAVATAAVALALARRARPAAVGALALAATLASPVAGLFLLVVAAGFVVHRRWVTAAVLAAGAGAPLAAVAAAFGAGGIQPMTIEVAVSPLIGGLIVAGLCRTPGIRLGGLVYAAGTAVCWLAPNPVGSNVERLGLLVAAPLVLIDARWPRPTWIAILPLLTVWLVHEPFVALHNGPDPMASRNYSTALVAELHRTGAAHQMVEVVPERDHWEAVSLRDTVALARGWERQIDVARNPLFYRGHLTAGAYHRWLLDRGVAWVALSDRPPDWAAVAEQRIVQRGQPWLPLVWSGPHWRLYRVTDAAPLASGAASIDVQPSQVQFTATHPGTVTLRLPWSRWLRVGGGPACLRDAGGRVAVDVRAPGRYRVTSSWTALGSSPCPAGSEGRGTRPRS